MVLGPNASITRLIHLKTTIAMFFSNEPTDLKSLHYYPYEDNNSIYPYEHNNSMHKRSEFYRSFEACGIIRNNIWFAILMLRVRSCSPVK